MLNESIFANLGASDLVISIIIGTLAFLWIRSILRITIDISRRTNSTLHQVISIIIGIIPFFGLFIYFLIRPVNYKFDKVFWRETISLQSSECPDCGAINLKEFDYCIYCGEKLKLECKECKEKYPFDYEYCPKCSAPNLIS